MSALFEQMNGEAAAARKELLLRSMQVSMQDIQYASSQLLLMLLSPPERAHSSSPQEEEEQSSSSSSSSSNSSNSSNTSHYICNVWAQHFPILDIEFELFYEVEKLFERERVWRGRNDVSVTLFIQEQLQKAFERRVYIGRAGRRSEREPSSHGPVVVVAHLDFRLAAAATAGELTNHVFLVLDYPTYTESLTMSAQWSDLYLPTQRLADPVVIHATRRSKDRLLAAAVAAPPPPQNTGSSPPTCSVCLENVADPVLLDHPQVQLMRKYFQCAGGAASPERAHCPPPPHHHTCYSCFHNIKSYYINSCPICRAHMLLPS